ncbi:cysteine--tRNA ligase [Candidatus Micrarchaeota archaeon CG_4_10_14_0_2_um_filter_55_9]|nr:MAG: cysteine--tRNA ligase [Candidatus Micrarchaeota archaeon CG1_02_55_41]PIO03463.1 MAG: cysteine--tRNA ligase [Candidatus Micrarchaeota archaeon CG09_land_8_20_14_0_10_55_25]PIZ91894.1 MAG: cysteine--tRNA ligase [Candidatus Micrarchaeota archaeon CG_4_10_14_0_2_um_filter_55_9]PJD01206.1 MAG: cysteine--tRNA ligase [Candidatus Micrarchaeota archaeon CG10_big_fil_rev_8_21_14_0_10_54_18]
MLKLYNSLTREKEEFRPLGGEATMYGCGPTVYNYAHIGNWRSFVFYDLLRRYLEYAGWPVNLAMNFTDVDDKTIRGSRAEGVPLKEFTRKYEEAFKKDSRKLNILPPRVYARATEHVNDMVRLVVRLRDRGLAYRAEDGSTYFDVSEFKGYGKLSHLDLGELREGASGRVSVDEYGKEEARDFALWKAWSEEDGDVYWDTVLGRGRPGWHVECSAMSQKYLGETIDVHAGGVDLIFPHHENEIAQSEGATGKPFVRYWVHCEHLLVDGRKMSKSLANFYTLHDLEEKGFKPVALRYFYLSAHYRSQLNFTLDALTQAQRTVEKLNDFVLRVRSAPNAENGVVTDALQTALKGFENAMDDDLDTANALPYLFEAVRVVNSEIEGRACVPVKDVLDFLMRVNSVLGVIDFAREEIPARIQKLVCEREKAREQKDFAKSDELRNKIRGEGFVVEDSAGGPRVRKA